MRAKELMTRTVHCINSKQNLNEASQLMWQYDCGWLPVIDEDGRLLATITDRDIAMAAFLCGKQLAEIQVAEAQSKTLVTCNTTDELAKIVQIMRCKQLHRIPIVDTESRLSGVISLNDLALAYLSRKNGIDAEGLCETLADICSHQHMYPPEAAGLNWR